MGAGSSNGQCLPPSPNDIDNFGDAVESRWSLPPPCEDEVWLKIDLASLVGTHFGIAGKCGRKDGRESSERRAESTARDNQAARAGQPSIGSFECDGEDNDWLESGICLSMASLKQEDMSVVVTRAKNSLHRTLSSVCNQNDVFYELLMERIHSLQCVHAAMTRHRFAQLEKANENAAKQGRRSAHGADDAGVAEVLDSCKISGDHLLGLRLFLSLLDFVREPECKQEQVADFIRQIEPVVSSLPPLCLAEENSGSLENVLFRQQTSRPASVVHSLRDFLAAITLAGINDKYALREGAERNDPTRTTRICDPAQRGLILSTLISLVAARGRASDILTLVKVLLSLFCCSSEGVVKTSQYQIEASDVAVKSGVGDEHVTTEYSAKRRPTSRVKARTYRQGLPVGDDDDDDDEHDVHDPILHAQPVVAMAVSPTVPTTSADMEDPWKTKRQAQLSGGSESIKALEVHTVKGRNIKRERMRSTPPMDQQPWQKTEKAGNQHNGMEPQLNVRRVDDEAGGVEACCILPFLRQLHTATPNESSRTPKTRPVHQRELWTCGQNSYGELGHNDTGTRKALCLVKAFEGKEIIDVAAGNEHTVVLCRTGEVFTAGYNDNGQCGQGATQRVGALTRVPMLDGKKAVQVHAYNGCEHTLVVLDDGRVVSFGYNYRGQLGHGNTTSERAPKPIRSLGGLRVTQASCSYYHSIITCDNSEVYAFGRNDFGQLGSGDTIDRKSPSLIDSLRGQRVTSLACGQYHTVVNTVEVGVQSCGKNDYGQLGLQSADFQNNFVVVKGALDGAKARQLSCGYYHTIVLVAGGHVIGFGRNDYGQLGLGHITQRVFGPKLIEGVEGKDIRWVSAGCYHTVLIASDSMLYVFGRNHHGQLGTGDTKERHSPFPVDTFLGKPVAKVAAGFYHTVVLTAGGDDDMSEMQLGRRVQTLSPHNILAHPALSLPPDDVGVEDAASANSKKQGLVQNCGEVISPEMSSPVCNVRDLLLSQRETTIGFGKAEESKDIRLDNGRVCAWNAAVFIMAQMDRLAQACAWPEGGTPIGGHWPNDNTGWTKTRDTGVLTEGRNMDNHHTYCVDVSPDTFEMLAFILAIISEDRQFGGVDGGSKFRAYVLVAAIRLLKVNLAGLLRDTISTCVKSRMASETVASFDFDDANQLQLEGDLGQDSLIGAILRDSPIYRASMSTSAPQTPSNTPSDQPAQGGQGLMGGDSRHVGIARPVVERYRNVLYVLRRRLLLLVHSSSCSDGLAGGEAVQREAAAALTLGLEIFFSSQTEQFRLLSELIINTGIDNDEEQESFIDGDSGDFDRLLCGPRAVRHYMLNPVLQRLCDDALASKLVPYGADLDNGSSICTVVEALPTALQDHRAIGASARFLEIHVKLLVDFIAQGSMCETYLAESFADDARLPTLFDRFSNGSPLSVHQLNDSTTDRTESFHLNAEATVNDGADGPDTSRRTHDLLVDLVLTLMKYMMHWAGSDRLAVDPSLWESRVLRADFPDQSSTGQRCSDRDAGSESHDWIAGRIKRMCDHAASVILDGVDRAPPSWRCLIRHSQLVLKYTTTVLEATLDKQARAREDEGIGTTEGIDGIDRLRETIVGQLFPAVVIGLLPFADNPVFARSLLGIVNEALVLLDEVCCRCLATRLAGSIDLVARKCDGAVPAMKQNSQTLFTRDENGKLRGGGTIDRQANGETAIAESEVPAFKGGSTKVDSKNISWLLSLAKTTASLAGRLAATLVIGDCVISPFLENYFSSLVYATWLESNLFSAGCDPFYERLLLSPLDISSRDADSHVVTSKPTTNSHCGGSSVTNGIAFSRRELGEFVEEVAGGFGKGGRFVTWLNEAFSPVNPAYRIVKRQASAGKDGKTLEHVERAMMAAMLRHAGLDGEAALFSVQLERRSGVDKTKGCTMPPRRFARLWKAVSEMACWLWECRSKLKSSDVDQSRVDAFFEEASDGCLLLILFKPSGEVPPALRVVQRGAVPSLSAERQTGRRMWRKVVALIRAVIRWKGVVTDRLLVEEIVTSVPRFLRGMLRRKADVGESRQLSRGKDRNCHGWDSVECPCVLLVLILDNHQRAVARASGLRFLCVLAHALRARSLLADALIPLVSALQTPRLVDRNILTHLRGVSRGVTVTVKATFQVLLGDFVNILREFCLAKDTIGHTNDEETLAKRETMIQRNESEGSANRNVDSRTVLVLLEAWGLTVRGEDWNFVEATGIIGVVSTVATQSETNARPACTAGVSSAAKRIGDITRVDEVISRKHRATHSQAHGANEQEQRSIFVLCHSAARTLFRSLIIQLPGTVRIPNNILFAEPLQLSSVFEVLHGELNNCVSRAESKARHLEHEPRRGSSRGGGSTHYRDRTRSEAILEFAPPLIGGFSDSPRHVRATPRGPGLGTGGISHKRRCQELINSPRRLMNMEDGLIFPAQQVLSNPRGSDFSITFWLLLGQDRTGHRRTVLARGQGRERWPVVLLRGTDNRIEVCFGVPSMDNLCERLTSKEPLHINRWTHVGLISELNKLRLYLNGTLHCQRTSTGSLRPNRHSLYVGKVPNNAIRLDGVRGGVEGSIANLRYFTRALSPIHVRIICDSGPPAVAKVEDRYCYHLCASLVAMSRSPHCRHHLKHPEWLRLLLQTFTYGTVRVQQAVCRLFKEILPLVSPDVMAKVTLVATGSPAVGSPKPQAPGRNGKSDEVTTETAFTDYLLRLIGASSWYAGATISECGRAVRGPRDGSSEEEYEMTIEKVLLQQQMMRFLPLTLTPTSVSRDHLGAENGDIQEGKSGGEYVDTNVDATAPSDRTTSLASAATAYDISTLRAEVVALVQTMAATDSWRKAVASSLQMCLFRLMGFVDGTGGFVAPNRFDESDHVEWMSAENRLAVAAGEAVLHVFGGSIAFLRPGICARVRETDQRCTVLSVDHATSTAQVMVHPADEAETTTKWGRRFFAHELEVEDPDILAQGAMTAFSAECTTSIVRDGENVSTGVRVAEVTRAFLRSSPLPRAQVLSGKRKAHHVSMASREIMLAQCRSRLAMAVLRASRDDKWVSDAVKSGGPLSELLRVSTFPRPTLNTVMGEESLCSKDIIALQYRLRQMLGAPGGSEIMEETVVGMVLFPGESSVITEEDGRDVACSGDNGGQGQSTSHHGFSVPGENTWINSLMCPFCQEVKSTASSIVEHVLIKHSADVRRMPCPLCATEKGDDTVHDLPTHLELIHMDAVLQDRHPLLPVFRRWGRDAVATRLAARPSSHLIEKLMVIGFPEDWCTLALRENDNDVVNASAWIVDNLDMLSSLNSLSVSREHEDEENIASPRARREGDGRRWHRPYRSWDEGISRGEMGPTERVRRLTEENKDDEFGYGKQEEKTYGEDEDDSDLKLEGRTDEDGQEEGEEGGGRGSQGDGGSRQEEEASESEEDDEDEDDEAADGSHEYGEISRAEHHQQIVVDPLPGSALNDAVDDEQERMAENSLRTTDGLIASDRQDRYFPQEQESLHAESDSPRRKGNEYRETAQPNAINPAIAGMELSRLIEVWLQAELHLTTLHCQAALVNMLLRWPPQVPLCLASLGSSAMVMKLIKSLVFRGTDLPVAFPDASRKGVLLPVPNGAQPPQMLGLFTPLLVHLLRSEREAQQPSRMHAEVSDMEQMEGATEDTALPGTGRKQAVAVNIECGEWQNTLSSRLVSFCLNELETAAAADAFNEKSWVATNASSPPNRPRGDGRRDLRSLQWLLDLLLWSNCGDVLTENVFSRLSQCLNSPSVGAKEVAIYVLTSIATKWCEHLWTDSDRECSSGLEQAPVPASIPSLFAMEETFQRHMSISRVRSSLAKRIAVERRLGGLFFTRYTQTLTVLYLTICKLQRLLLCCRRQSACGELGEVDSEDEIETSIPTILYCTDSCVALKWLPLRKMEPTSNIVYEVQIAARLLGNVSGTAVFRSVYAGKRLRCKVDDLMPGQVYRFRLRAVLAGSKMTAWSPEVSAETEQGIAFCFDSSNSGPDIFVSGNDELSASYESNENWSTILGTTPFFTGHNYWELHVDKSVTSYFFIGVATREVDLTTFLGGDDNGWGFIGDRALYHKRAKVKAYGERFGQGDIVGLTLNMDRGTLSFSKNGLDLGIAFEGLAGGLYPAVAFYNRGQRASLVQSAFRCPGAGVTILSSPLSTPPEAVSVAFEVMEAMVLGNNLPKNWIQAIAAGHMAWITGDTVRYATRLGFELQFDISDLSCRRFGLKAQARVRTPRGSATVIGLCEGVMWFHVKGESGAWFFTAGEIWEGRADGFFIVSSLDVVEADGKEGWARWKALDANKEKIRVEKERKGVSSRARSSKDELEEGRSFATARDCAKWTPAVDGSIVAALCHHADRRQVSVWNLTPNEVLRVLRPMRRKLELSLAGESEADNELLCRVSVLKQFNHEIIGILPFVDLAEGVKVSGLTETRAFCWGQSSRQRGLAVGGEGRPTRGLGPLLVHLRQSIFLETKQTIFSRAVSVTTTYTKKVDDEYDYPETLPQLTVNRLKAAAGQESSNAQTRLRSSVFQQLCRELRTVDTSLLRMGYTHPMDDGQQRTFKVKFEGEGVDDYGGPYREIFTQVAAELTAIVSPGLRKKVHQVTSVMSPDDFTSLLPILQPSRGSGPTGDRNVGMEFTVKAGVCQEHRLLSYKFLGQLIGIALRSRVTVQWKLSPVFWKGLVGEALQESDLAFVDSLAYKCVHSIRDRIAELNIKNREGNGPADAGTGGCDVDRPTEVGSADAAGLQQLAEFSGGLICASPGYGKISKQNPDDEEDVNSEVSRLSRYAQEVVYACLHEGDTALFAVRDGLASVVPAAILPLFTWKEMELQACGRPGVDIDLLQANTEYDDDISSTDAHIQSFWRVLRSFDDWDRSHFLRFVWARSRLPSKTVDFQQKFKIHSPTGDGPREEPDQYLPKAHTCFFSINLPRYSSDEVMADKLRYTMYNCIEMDADFRLAANEISEWANDGSARSIRGQSGDGGANLAD